MLITYAPHRHKAGSFTPAHYILTSIQKSEFSRRKLFCQCYKSRSWLHSLRYGSHCLHQLLVEACGVRKDNIWQIEGDTWQTSSIYRVADRMRCKQDVPPVVHSLNSSPRRSPSSTVILQLRWCSKAGCVSTSSAYCLRVFNDMTWSSGTISMPWHRLSTGPYKSEAHKRPLPVPCPVEMVKYDYALAVHVMGLPKSTNTSPGLGAARSKIFANEKKSISP